MDSSRTLLAAGMALLACGRSLPPGAPEPASMVPATAHTTADVPVVIKGAGFLLLASRHVGQGRVGLDSAFHAWLGETPLGEVAWVDEHTLRAVVPAGLEGDELDLTVQGPTGRGTLTKAFRASPLSAPALAISKFQIPASLSRGQIFTATLEVTNTGQEAAIQVVPDPPVSGGAAHALVVSPPSAATVPGGGTVQFAWTLLEDGAAPGPLSLTTGVAGIDPNSRAVIAAPAATSNAAVVQAPAALVVTSLTAPSLISRGQPFNVSMVVTNTGEATALNVAPSPNPPSRVTSGGASAGAPAALKAVTLTGGQSATFTYGYLENGTGTGSLSFTAGAAGTDANSGAVLTTLSSSASIAVQQPASLSVTGFTLRSTLGSSTFNRGQAFTASLTATNTGDATATLVLPSVPTVTITGGAAASTSSNPPAASIAGGSSATFRWDWVENGTSPGSLRLTSTVKGSDGNSGKAIPAVTTQSELATVQAPATLSAVISAPPLVSPLTPFTVSLTVTNGGQGTVNALTPSLAVAGASTTVVSGPTPASASLAGGASATFSWTCRAGAAGVITFTASASGTDVNDGSTRSASATTSRTASEVSRIASDPFGDSTPFSYVFDFNGRVYLGPNKGNTGGVRMLPDGSSLEKVSFAFNNDLVQTNSNRYGGGLGPYPSLGFSGCTPDTAQCGPDNEDGRGVYGAGLIAGTPWLIASGSISGGNFAHLYATADTMTAPNFNYVGVRGGFSAEVQGTSAMVVFHDRVYLGLPSNKGNRPFVGVIKRMPLTPGYDAISTSDADDLGATRMPYLGATGSPANPAGMQVIDSFAIFNDRLYLGNNGGWMRSTNNAPAPYAAAPGDWAVAAPSAAAYAAKTSVTTTKLADLLPADRALPQMAVLGSNLYAARNTTAGPQLWACTPGASLACDPANWSLIAANTSGDVQLSQFGDPKNTSITLLVATPKHLYVGFDDATDGVRLYRSTTTSPSTLADFQGKGGCSASAGSASCPGLGGNGFGVGATQMFDGRALNYGGLDYLYLTAGTGTSGVRVFRLAE